MDITLFTTALSSLKNATDIAKIFKEADASFESAEFKLKASELLTELAEAKYQISEIKNALLEKDDEISALKEQLAIKGNIKWESPYYWLIDEEKKDGPYCQCCFDKDKKLIRLQEVEIGFWHCKACDNSYSDRNFKSSSEVFSSAPKRGGFDWGGY